MYYFLGACKLLVSLLVASVLLNLRLGFNIITTRSSQQSSLPKLRAFYNQSITSPGILMNPIGGIGNQLFIYACSYSLAKDLNYSLYVYTSPNGQNLKPTRGFHASQRNFALDKFKIPELNLYDKTSKVKGVSYYNDEQFLDRNFSRAALKGFIQVSGYCQSPVYWEAQKEDIINIFQPPEQVVIESMNKSVKLVLEDIWDTESVAVHVRRGDFLLERNDAFFVPISYQRSAIRRMIQALKVKRSVADPVFFVFSDDISFAKREFVDFADKFRFVYVSEYNSTSIQDLYLMINCKHLIIPNSTFSWWAAYLNKNLEKVVIASAFNPEFYVSLGSKRLHGTLYHPMDWVVIDVFSGEH